MSQEQFKAIIPYIIADLKKEISKRQGLSDDEVAEKLYKSKLYAKLEKESTKVWQYSTPMLYSLFEQEQNTGTIRFPDV